MANAVVVRISRLNSMAKLQHQKKHDEREYTDRERPKYIDTSRSHLNSVIIKHKTVDEIKQYIDKVRQGKRKLRSNAVLLWSGLIAFGTEAQQKINQLSKEQQDRLFYQIAKAIADYLDVDLASLSVHRDETSIHAHFSIYAFNRKGQSLSKTVKLHTLAKLQDIAADVVKGLGIGRGKKKLERLKLGEDYSRLVHKSVRQLHYELPLEIQAKQQRIKMLDNEIEAKKKMLNDILTNIQALENRQNELIEKVKTYEERVQRQEEKLQRLISKRDAIQNEIKDKVEQANKTLKVYARRRDEAKAELEAIQQQIGEKKKELEKLLEEITKNNYKEKYERAREWMYYLRDILKYVFDTYNLYEEKWLFEEMPDLYDILGLEKEKQVEKVEKQRNNNPNSPKM